MEDGLKLLTEVCTLTRLKSIMGLINAINMEKLRGIFK